MYCVLRNSREMRNMDSRQVGSFIANLRKEQSMTQKELANILNITDKAVSKWENGDGYPEITLVPPLAEVLGVTTDELFRGERAGVYQQQEEPPKGAQAQFFSETALIKFKNLSLVAIGLAVLGLIAFFTITHSTYYESIGFGIQVTFLLASVILFKIAYDSYLNAAAKFRELSNEDQSSGISYTNKTLIASIWLWVCSLVSTLPYLIFNESVYVKSIITFQTYIGFLPVFLLLGASASWLLSSIVKDNLRLKPENDQLNRRLDKICFAGLASDIYFGLIFVGAVFLGNYILLPFGLLSYLSIPAVYAVWHRGKVSRVLTAAFFVRNIIVGLTIGFGVGKGILFYGTGRVEVVWARINISLFVYVLPAIILMTWALQYLASRMSKIEVTETPNESPR